MSRRKKCFWTCYSPLLYLPRSFWKNQYSIVPITQKVDPVGHINGSCYTRCERGWVIFGPKYIFIHFHTFKHHSCICFNVFHTCMGWTISCERLPSIFVFSYDLADFQITSNYLIPFFPWSPSWETTTNLEGSTFTRPSTLFHSF